MNHVEAWLRYYDKYRANESKRILMEAAWCKALAKIDGERRQEEKRQHICYQRCRQLSLASG